MFKRLKLVAISVVSAGLLLSCGGSGKSVKNVDKVEQKTDDIYNIKKEYDAKISSLQDNARMLEEKNFKTIDKLKEEIERLKSSDNLSDEESLELKEKQMLIAQLRDEVVSANGAIDKLKQEKEKSIKALKDKLLVKDKEKAQLEKEYQDKLEKAKKSEQSKSETIAKLQKEIDELKQSNIQDDKDEIIKQKQAQIEKLEEEVENAKKASEDIKKEEIQKEIKALESSQNLSENTPKVLKCKLELPMSEDGGVVFEWASDGLNLQEKGEVIVATRGDTSSVSATLKLKARYHKTSDIFVEKTYQVDLSQTDASLCDDSMIVEEKTQFMFTPKDDTEIFEEKPTLYSKDLRGFYVNNLLEFSITEDKKLRLRNILPHTFKDITLFAHVKNSGKKLKLKSFESIEPFVFADFTFKLDKLGLKQADISKENISFELESSDAMLAKIKQITIPTRYQIGLYGTWDNATKTHTNQEGWERIFAKDVKNFIPLITNMSFVLSSQEFKNSARNAHFEFSNNCRHQKDGTIPDNGTCVKLDPEEIITRFTSVGHQNIGLVSKVAGLGGGSTFGMGKVYISDPKSVYYEYNVKGMEESLSIRNPLEVYAHEFAHVCGYGHEGNMTYIGSYVYPNGDESKKDERKLAGMASLIGYLYQDLLLKKKLPFNSYPYGATKD